METKQKKEDLIVNIFAIIFAGCLFLAILFIAVLGEWLTIKNQLNIELLVFNKKIFGLWVQHLFFIINIIISVGAFILIPIFFKTNGKTIDEAEKSIN